MYQKEEKDIEDVWKGIYHEEGAFLYREWDFARQHYRKNWCVLRELELPPATRRMWIRCWISIRA
ncbi:hypothetical protein [Thiothrix subterranea]|uniref:hypothetical protein n=1 Tax=Thiothrix subterranea TaxID=2735563 RepID=UPI00280ABFAF|nr:hypothetical protein [Thiothrix subterranea]